MILLIFSKQEDIKQDTVSGHESTWKIWCLENSGSSDVFALMIFSCKDPLGLPTSLAEAWLRYLVFFLNNSFAALRLCLDLQTPGELCVFV